MENRPSSDGLASIRRDFLATGDAATALAVRTAQVDRLVLEAAAELLLPAAPAGLAVLAVGGYGRRQLFPYSDVDLLLLFESEKLALASKDAIAAFLQHLWDSGLRVSHSVRTPAECTEVHDRNIELNISLLDQRYLTGDRALYAGLAEKLPRFIHGNREPLVRNLAQLTRDRHAKYAGTFYHLEPNVKETPGGLRDHQLVCWLDQLHGARGRQPAPELRGRLPLSGAAALLSALPVRARQQRAFLRRPGRHRRAMAGGRRRPMDARLLPPRARRLPRRHPRPGFEPRPSPARCFAQFRDWRSRVSNADFSVHRERVHFRAPQRLDVEPELALRLFEFVARHGIRLSFEAEQRIESRLAAPARALRRAAAPVARAEHDPLAPARAAGRARDARNRRAGRHFPGDWSASNAW